MQKALGQPIVIENIGGAGGMIAAAKAARADPDGYTILLHQEALAAGMALYPDRTFDAEKDFVPIGLINTVSNTLAGRPTLPPNNFKELLPWLKQPGRQHQDRPSRRRLVRSSGRRADLPGAGREGHAGALSRRRPGAGRSARRAKWISSLISAVVAGPLVKAGKLKAYAIIGKKRFAGLPDLPTFGELGYKKLDIDFWHMLLAPAGTPRPIIDKLNAALRAALADPKVKKTLRRRRHGRISRPTRKRRKPRAHCSRARSRCGAKWSATTTSRGSSEIVLAPSSQTSAARALHARTYSESARRPPRSVPWSDAGNGSAARTCRCRRSR